MDRQLPQPFLSSEERIALNAAIADLCFGDQASAEQDTAPALNLGVKHPVIVLTLSAVALLTTHTAWMSARF